MENAALRLYVCIMSVQSEPDGFASFHLYVCAAFLTRFSRDLQRERDFHVSRTVLTCCQSVACVCERPGWHCQFTQTLTMHTHHHACTRTTHIQ